MPENLTTMQKIDGVRNMLDKLTDAQGRAKCAYIYAIDEFMVGIRDDLLILEEKLKDANKAPETIKMEGESES